MDVVDLLLLINVAINVLLGATIFIMDPRKRAHIYFTLISLSVAGWCSSMFFYRSAMTPDEALMFAKLLYAAAALIPLFFVQFTINFPLKPVISIFTRAVLYLVPIIIFLISILSAGIVKGVRFNAPYENILLFGDWYAVYFAYIVLYFLLGYTILGLSFLRTQGIERKQIQYVFWGTFIASNFGMLTNLILPSLGMFELNWLGNLLTISMVGLIAIAMFKHHLFNVKIIATELLVFFIWGAVFVEVILADNVRDRLIEFGLFIFVVIFGIMIIRSVLKEVRQKEELAKLSQELAAANEHLKELDKLKNDFVSIASHQLRSPLTAIKGYSSMVLEGSMGKVSKEALEAVDKIFQSSERLTAFVNELLDISRIERGKMEYNFEKADFVAIARSVCEELKMVAEKKGLKLECHGARFGAVKLKLDQNKIRQVMQNLLDNAIKYTPQGRIDVRLARQDGNIELTITDTGVGIAPDDIDQLFDKFARAKGIIKVDGTGTGLGLYVAREIARGHGGDVTVASSGKGQGSTFTLRLPVNRG